MLLQFSVENYRSFKDNTVFSLEGSADKELPGNFYKIGDDKVLKVAAIYGANASGKSNFIKALEAGISIVRNSNKRDPDVPISEIVPFLFKEDSETGPTSFEFVFIQNSTKYVYGFSATKDRVVSEYLYKYRTAKASTIFERDMNNTPEYRFTIPSVRKALFPLVERNADNKLFLATAAVWNSEEAKIPYSWFTSRIQSFSTNYDSLFFITAPMFDEDKDNSLKKFTNHLLHEADINIDDFTVESHKLSDEQFAVKIPAEARAVFDMKPKTEPKDYTIKTVHHTDGSMVRYSLPLLDESEGTRSIFLLSPILKEAFDQGNVIIIDEFDTHLHPMLVVFLVGLFNNPEINTGNAQLIVTTHTTELLSLRFLRRDQIYFVQKNEKTSVSELYSLDEFSPRTRDDIRKAYLAGRYGSIPNIIGGSVL